MIERALTEEEARAVLCAIYDFGLRRHGFADLSLLYRDLRDSLYGAENIEQEFPEQDKGPLDLPPAKHHPFQEGEG